MPTLTHLTATASAEQIAALLDSDGALILDDVLTPAEAGRVEGEIAPYIEATATGRDSFTGYQTTRTGALVARSAACRDLVMHPAILAACDTFLKRACDRYQLHLTQAIRIRPGQPKQALHRDRLAWGGFLPASIEPQLNTIWAMTDFTQENGAIRNFGILRSVTYCSSAGLCSAPQATAAERRPTYIRTTASAGRLPGGGFIPGCLSSMAKLTIEFDVEVVCRRYQRS